MKGKGREKNPEGVDLKVSEPATDAVRISDDSNLFIYQQIVRTVLRTRGHILETS